MFHINNYFTFICKSCHNNFQCRQLKSFAQSLAAAQTQSFWQTKQDLYKEKMQMKLSYWNIGQTFIDATTNCFWNYISIEFFFLPFINQGRPWVCKDRRSVSLKMSSTRLHFALSFFAVKVLALSCPMQNKNKWE